VEVVSPEILLHCVPRYELALILYVKGSRDAEVPNCLLNGTQGGSCDIWELN
jgi:hypothetical protein